MKRDTNGRLLSPAERIRLKKPMGRPLFRLLAFVACLSILVAVFAVSGICSGRGTPEETLFGGIFHRKRITRIPKTDDTPATDPSAADEEPPRNPSEKRPDGAVSVFTQTVCGNVQGQNADDEATPWRIDLSGEAPEVLIVCTYPSEAYLAEPAEWIDGAFGDAIVSEETVRCVTAIGAVLRDVLASNGVKAVCADMGTEASMQGAHARAAKVIAEWLERYPTIRYVVDVGRDVPFDSEGRCIRTVAEDVSPSVAQIMAVVGTSCPAWKENLAFAEAFGREMERECPTSFRGVGFRTSSVNQQFAPRSLKLEIGSCANTVEEATRAAQLAGKALANILTEPFNKKGC